MNTAPETDRALLTPTRGSIDRIQGDTFGGRWAVPGSRLVQGAVTQKLQTLAEPTPRRGDALEAEVPTAPWRAISGCCDVPTHGRLGFDPAGIWNVVEQDPPALVQAVARMQAGRNEGEQP